jgi:hypothetical protein
MSITLNSLKSDNTPSFDINNFIKTKDEEYRKAYSNNNSNDNNTNIVASAKPVTNDNKLASTATSSLTKIIDNSNVREKVNGLVNTTTSLPNTIQDNLKDCLNNEVSNTTGSLNKSGSSLNLINDFKNSLKNPEAFLGNVAKSFMESKSD